MAISKFTIRLLETVFLWGLAIWTVFGQNSVSVSVSVSAFDRKNDPITSLSKENFILKENGKRKDIVDISYGDEPTTFAIMFDVSGSMTSKPFSASANRIEVYRSVIAEFIRERRADDEYFVMSFAEVTKDITSYVNPENAIKAVANETQFQKPEKHANTNLFGSLIHAINKLKEAKNERRVIVLLSDGVDTAATYAKKREVHRLLENRPITVFHLSIPSEASHSTYLGLSEMKKLTDRTGGSGWLIYRRTELEIAKKGLSDHLKSHYRLFYNQDSLPARERKRRIQISLEIPREQRRKVGQVTLFYRSVLWPTTDSRTSN